MGIYQPKEALPAWLLWGSVLVLALLAFFFIFNLILRRRVAEKTQSLVAANAALQQSRERYRTLVEDINDVIFSLDSQGRFTYISPAIERLAAYSQADIVGQPFSRFVHPDDLAGLQASLERTVAGQLEPYEFRVLDKNGRVLYVRTHCRPLPEDGRPPGLTGVLIDLTSRKQVEEQIKASLQEKEVLLQEIHHRVKNNLQIIASLLDLQAGSLPDPHLLPLFQESQDRVRSMALVHEKLYQSADLARIDFAEYLQDMLAHLGMAYGDRRVTVKLQVQAEQVDLGIDTAIPCGLIINELVSNALKYAFPAPLPEREPEIRVEFAAQQGTYRLSVSDNGVGLSPDFELERAPSLGLHLVQLLAGQLQGQLEVDGRQGTTFSLKFARRQQAKGAQ